VGGPFEYARQWHEQLRETGWWHSFELPDGSVIQGINTLDAMRHRIGQFPIPADLRGKRALDIGCWDGWFSFELERRGAEVVAVDCFDNPRFREMHEIYQSKVDYRQMDMYELTPERMGRFDVVLFMGVLYHLKHPLLALERVCALTTDLAAVDSLVLREQNRPREDLARPIMEFYETDELGGQLDNWFGPSLPCLLGMCRTAGFACVELRSVLEYSACVACFRHWEDPAGAGEPPMLHRALHMHNAGINFNSSRDEYIAAWFSSSEKSLSLQDLKPEVGEFGVYPLSVTHLEGDSWQVNFKLPPLPNPGWYDIRIRTGGSVPSNALRIALDLPVPAAELRLQSVCDAATWKPGELDPAKGRALALWIEGLPDNADANNVRATLAGRPLRTLYVEPDSGKSARQVNVELTAPPPLGPAPLVVAIGPGRTAPTTVQLLSNSPTGSK
jgi:tRNA (mo5U34)-methyltransferase